MVTQIGILPFLSIKSLFLAHLPTSFYLGHAAASCLSRLQIKKTSKQQFCSFGFWSPLIQCMQLNHILSKTETACNFWTKFGYSGYTEISFFYLFSWCNLFWHNASTFTVAYSCVLFTLPEICSPFILEKRWSWA